MSAENPVHLVFDPSLKVAGQVLEGSVELYWPEAVDKNIEEVIIKLRGELSTYVCLGLLYILLYAVLTL